MHLNTIHS